MLSQKELEEFNINGFMVIRDFVDKDFCDLIYKVAQYHLDNEIKPIESEAQYSGKKYDKTVVRRLRQVYDRDEIFAKWMRNKDIANIVKEILGEDISLTLAHHNSIMTKIPLESTQTSWHQDIRYWNFENDNLISIWLALGTENSDNGVLEFIPGSHKMKFKDNQFDEKMYFKCDTKNQPFINTKKSFDLNKGDVVLFHAKTLHRANPNITDKVKISFVYTLKAISNKAIKGTVSDFKEVNLL